MKRRQPLRFLTLILLLTLPGLAQAQFTFTTNADNSISITKYTGPGGAVFIPDTTNGMPVTSIAYGAFYLCTNVSSVSIPNSVTSIGYGAFWSCSNMTSVSIPNSVTNIGDYAFKQCTSLPSIVISTSVTSIGSWVFGSCSSLSSVTLPENVTSIGDCTFNWCVKLTSVIIPSSVISIGSGAFSWCKGLTGITLPIGINRVNDSLFEGCNKLANVTIPNSVTSIGNSAFWLCSGLNAVTIPNGVTSIGAEAFRGCYSLSSITIPPSVISIGNSAFDSCNGLTNVTISQNVTNIGSGSFNSCASLRSINVDEENPAYASWAGVLFDKTQTLLLQYPAGKAGVAYTIPNTVTIIADSAFSWCLNLTNITIPSSVTNIGSSAFFECYYLTSVFFGGDAPWSVGSYLFDLIAGTSSATVFYLPGTAGWASMFAGRPTALWFLPNPLILSGPSFGIQTNRFGFVVSWATNLSVIVEGSTDLVHGSWSPLSTNALTNGSSYFSDPNWINHPTRFYRIRSP